MGVLGSSKMFPSNRKNIFDIFEQAFIKITASTDDFSCSNKYAHLKSVSYD